MPYSDQDNGQALRAGMNRNPLRPLSESCLNSHVPGIPELKRKRGFRTESYELGETFTILVRLRELIADSDTDPMLTSRHPRRIRNN